MKEIILEIIREYSINAKNYDVTILREDLDNMSDDMVREITRYLEKEVSTQDIPAVRISTNPNTPNVWKELYDRYKLTSLVDDLNVIDTRDEIDTKEEKGDIDFMYKWIREKSGK